MSNEVAQPLSDEGIEARLAECIKFAREIEELQKTDPAEHKRRIAYLRVISQRTGAKNEKLAALAQSVLEELNIDTSPISREDIKEALRDDGSFMGADDPIAPIEDVKQDRAGSEAIFRFEVPVEPSVDGYEGQN